MMRWMLFGVITSLFGFYCFVRLFQPSAFIHVGNNTVALATVFIDSSWDIQQSGFDREELFEVVSKHNLPQGVVYLHVPVIYDAQNKLTPPPNNRQREIRIFDTSLLIETAPLDPFGVPYTLRLISIDKQKYWIRDSHMDSVLFQYKADINFTPVSTNWFSSML
ncbi:MAG: hypothetical protein VX786_03395 [Pseudomonadota bacterium]|nr:hypothetical protein [Pseudomonadota bacterium]